MGAKRIWSIGNMLLRMSDKVNYLQENGADDILVLKMAAENCSSEGRCSSRKGEEDEQG